MLLRVITRKCSPSRLQFTLLVLKRPKTLGACNHSTLFFFLCVSGMDWAVCKVICQFFDAEDFKRKARSELLVQR